MADGKYILARIGQILESSSKITDFVAQVDGHSAIWVARTNPVGNDYPQITMDIEFLDSHPVFSTQEAILTIDTWLTQSATESLVSQALSKLQPINNEIKLLLNQKAGQQIVLSEINIEENIGLRISRCLKSFQKDMEWDTTTNRMFATITFNLVLSENEDFQTCFGDELIV